MRVQTKLFLCILAPLILLVSGCGKYHKSGDVPPASDTIVSPPTHATGVIPGTPGQADPLNPASGVWSTGGSATFHPVSSDVFNKWVGGHPVEPQNLMINVNLTKASGKPTYYGEVKIRYQYNGATYEATLKTGSSTYNGEDDYGYNYWFDQGGKKVFSGFMDDKVGAIVLVIDQYLDLGDGGGASEVGGEVWFKNFGQSWCDYDGKCVGYSFPVVRPCWFRTTGPYDCRSNSVMTKSSLYPDGYEKLGVFSNMNKLKAFAE